MFDLDLQKNKIILNYLLDFYKDLIKCITMTFYFILVVIKFYRKNQQSEGLHLYNIHICIRLQYF